MRKTLPTTLIVLAMGVFWFLGTQKSEPTSILTLAGATMGTSWNVQLNTTVNDPALPALSHTLTDLLATLDTQIFSTWAPESELNRLNQAPIHENIAVSAELMQVLSASADIYEQSGGVFDITIAPLVDLWGFGPGANGQPPTAEAIALARSRMGMQHLVLQPNTGTVRKLADIQLDLSGIAKGYAVDRVAALLRATGFNNFLVEIGGELSVQGTRPDGSNWRVAIEKPHNGQREMFQVFESKGAAHALAGSGDYRNYRVVDGKRVSHEIDPRTAHPIEHPLAAVTVRADTAMTADAWATALMVLGPEAGRQMADRLGLDAYFIIHDDTGFEANPTEGMSRYLVHAEARP